MTYTVEIPEWLLDNWQWYGVLVALHAYPLGWLFYAKRMYRDFQSNTRPTEKRLADKNVDAGVSTVLALFWPVLMIAEAVYRAFCVVFAVARFFITLGEKDPPPAQDNQPVVQEDKA